MNLLLGIKCTAKLAFNHLVETDETSLCLNDKGGKDSGKK